jgi:hypothetical protein
MPHHQTPTEKFSDRDGQREPKSVVEPIHWPGAVPLAAWDPPAARSLLDPRQTWSSEADTLCARFFRGPNLAGEFKPAAELGLFDSTIDRPSLAQRPNTPSAAESSGHFPAAAAEEQWQEEEREEVVEEVELPHLIDDGPAPRALRWSVCQGCGTIGGRVPSVPGRVSRGVGLWGKRETCLPIPPVPPAPYQDRGYVHQRWQSLCRGGGSLRLRRGSRALCGVGSGCCHRGIHRWLDLGHRRVVGLWRATFAVLLWP